MGVGSHQTESMDFVSKTLDALLHQEIELETVFLAEKDLLPSASAHHDMV